MRQRAYFHRYTAVGENPRNICLVGLRPNQAFVKAIGLPKLKTDPLDGIAKLGRGGFFAERMQNAQFVRREVLGVAGRKSAQQFGVARLGLGDHTLALARRIRRVESQHLVHQSKVPVIVQQALVSGDLGIHTDPEAHVGLKFRRVLERVRGGDLRAG